MKTYSATSDGFSYAATHIVSFFTKDNEETTESPFAKHCIPLNQHQHHNWLIRSHVQYQSTVAILHTFFLQEQFSKNSEPHYCSKLRTIENNEPQI